MADQVRHRTFIIYHQDDRDEVDEFIRTFDHERDVFIARAVGSDETMEDLVGGDDDDYIMRQIREKYLSDTTVTLAFIGERTWTRKFVDWELAASLHQGPSAGKPNGLLAILSPKLTQAILPDRFVDNWQPGYATFTRTPRTGRNSPIGSLKRSKLEKTRNNAASSKTAGESSGGTSLRINRPAGQTCRPNRMVPIPILTSPPERRGS